MERAPALAPVGIDVVDAAGAEHLPHAPSPPGPVGGELEPAVRVHLLEPFREELEHDGSRLLGPIGADSDRDAAKDAAADQRNAARILSRNSSSPP